jgi:ferredoxin like protein
MAVKVNVAEKLGANKFNTDEHNSHIEVDKDYKDKNEISRVVRVCPAAAYSLDENDTLFFEYLGCLECGTCKALSEGKLVKNWNYPAGARGIEYRLG